MSSLFTPLDIRGVSFRNRAWLSPMCQYSATDGMPNSWHLAHLSKFAVGGSGLVMTEATSVVPEGRISPDDTGLWNDGQTEAWAEIVRLIKAQGSAAGVQLAHAGRKASTSPPWHGTEYVSPDDGGWVTVGPSEIGFGTLPAPRVLSTEETGHVARQFAEAARRADEAGFDVVEIHAAHGYLLHQYLSPLANERTDRYGGSFENRIRITLETAAAVRGVWPQRKPLFVRVSATDWTAGGWDVDQTVELSRLLREHGVDLIDCSTGGMVPHAHIPIGPGYQVPFAERVRLEAGIKTAAVGLITEADQADEIISEGRADAVMMGREMLRQPNWPLLAAASLGDRVTWPLQYERAQPRPR